MGPNSSCVMTEISNVSGESFGPYCSSPTKPSEKKKKKKEGRWWASEREYEEAVQELGGVCVWGAALLVKGLHELFLPFIILGGGERADPGRKEKREHCVTSAGSLGALRVTGEI